MTQTMDHLHQAFDLNQGDIVEIVFDNPANVHLMDSENYEKYKKHEKFDYLGGFARESPSRFTIPRDGHWHVVIDLGGGPGAVSAMARIYSEDDVAYASSEDDTDGR